MKMVTFLRRDSKLKKFGKRRGKKAKWRSPKGRDNKLREKRKGYGKVVSIGYSSDKKSKGKLNGKTPVVINNIKDLKLITPGKIGVVSKVGKKKKMEIAKKAKELNAKLRNLNTRSFLKLNEKKEKKDESKK